GVVGAEKELRLPVVIDGPQPAVHRGAHVTARRGGLAAREVTLGEGEPFAVPRLRVAGNHPSAGLQAFAAGAAPLLGLAEPPPELVREPRMLGPVMPAERLVMRRAVVGDGLDDIVVAQDHRRLRMLRLRAADYTSEAPCRGSTSTT